MGGERQRCEDNEWDRKKKKLPSRRGTITDLPVLRGKTRVGLGYVTYMAWCTTCRFHEVGVIMAMLVGYDR